VRRVPLVTGEPVRGATAWDKVAAAIGGSTAALALLALAALAGLAALRVRVLRQQGKQHAGRRR
jgi:hypothetical protein